MPNRLRTSFGLTGRVQPVQLDAAAGGLQQGGEHFDRGRLAGAVRPQERDDLAPLDFKGDVVHGGKPPNFLVRF